MKPKRDIHGDSLECSAQRHSNNYSWASISCENRAILQVILIDARWTGLLKTPSLLKQDKYWFLAPEDSSPYWLGVVD